MNRLKVLSQRLFSAGLLILCLVAAWSIGEAAEPVTPWENDVSLGVGVDFSTSRYGTHSRTESLSIPVTLEWRPHKRFDIQLSLPYIYQSNSITPAYVQSSASDVTTAANSQFQQVKTVPATGSQGKSGQATPVGAMAGSGTGVPQLGQNSSQNGIGDMTLQVGFALIEENLALPQLRVLGYCKFPTGDRDNWLGSGEFDEGVGLSLSKTYGDLALYLEGIWIFQGGSDFLVESGFTVKDYLNYYAEISYQATDMLVPALVLTGASPSSKERGGTVEGRLKLSWRMSEHTSLQGYAGMGFTEASADMTAGVSFFYSF